MSITVHCPSCAAKYKAREESLGANARCKKCGATFTVAIALDETAGRPLKSASTSLAKPASAAGGVSGSNQPPDAAIQPLDENPRKRIGKYHIRRKLGAGGMGEVWLGHDPDLERDVAIKILPAMTQDQESLKRFLREARLAAKLHHTNTVTVYEVGVDGKGVFIAMELVDGQSLDKAVETRGPLPWREATQAIRDAATGLSAAHELGLVHRDIKPANLMRTAKSVTKVVDFGLARAQVGESRLTQEKMVLGTPAYMAPEQWMGGEIDGRADLYSLTCTYYHLLTGQPPFDAPSFVALGYQHRHEPIPDPRLSIAELPDAVCRILVHGSQKSPRDRFQTAVQLRAALDSLLSMPNESNASKLTWAQLSRQATQPADSGSQDWLSTVRASTPIQQVRKHLLVAASVAVAILIAYIAVAMFTSRSPSPEPILVARNSTPPAPLVPENRSHEDSKVAAPIAPPSEVQMAKVTTPPDPKDGTTRSLTRGQFDDTNLEVLEDIEPQFTPVAAAEGAKIEEARSSMLAELGANTFELSQIMSAISQPLPGISSFGQQRFGSRGPDGSAPSSASLNIPTHFILTGTLGAVRVQGRSTWVFLWVPGKSGSISQQRFGAGPYSSSMGGRFALPPVAAIEFPGVDLTLSIPDYRIGEEVCVVVKRNRAAAQPAGAANPMVANATRVNPQMMPQAISEYIQEFRQFSGGGAYWTLEGEALEKPLRPETWVDAKLGRAARLTNEPQVLRSPGQIMRSLPRHEGTKGILTAQFQSVSQSSSTGRVTVKLLIPTTCEGPITVTADMGAGVSARDFLGFQVGDAVLAAVRLTAANNKGPSGAADTLAGLVQSSTMASYGSRFGPAGGPTGAMPGVGVGGADPLTAWWGISADCTRLNKENDPTSLVAPGAQKQTTTVAMLTPTQATANLDGSVGIDVVWTGKLRQVRQIGGDAHFLIDGSGDTPGSFEAFTRTADFIDWVTDFRSTEENSENADEVAVTGKLVAGGGTKERIRSWSPMVQLTEIRRVDRAESVAKADQIRSSESFDPNRKLSDVHALWRKPPQVLPNKAKGNVGASVVWAGKLKSICQLDGETHFDFDGQGSTTGEFETYTTTADFLAQVTDYVTDEENPSSADIVIVSGKIVDHDSASARLSRRDVPLLQLAEIRRADQPESVATPDRSRDAGKFDTHRKLPELNALLRSSPAVGSEVRFRAFFHSFSDSSNPKYVDVTAIPDGSKSIKVTFPKAGKKEYDALQRDDAVVITGVVTKSDRSNRFSLLEVEGKSLVHALGGKK